MKQQPFSRSKRLKSKEECGICRKERPISEMVMGSLVRPSVAELIRKRHPDWTNRSYICLEDLHRFRMLHVQEEVGAEMGELTDLERRVLSSMEEHSLIAEEIIGEYEGRLSKGERMADRIASFGGSWKFIGLFFAVLVIWMLGNTFLLLARPFDPYPFILLNLVLSCLAAIQAPLIMMSQNRRERKDRAQAQHDYQVNLKAELEIRQLHEKMDHVLVHQWQRMVEIQQTQTELIGELLDWHEARNPRGEK